MSKTNKKELQREQKSPAHTRIKPTGKELTETQLEKVSGGMKPQQPDDTL